MRTQFRSLLYFTVLFMSLFSSSIFADDWDLMNITIPAWEHVDPESNTAQSQYTEPSKAMADLMTDWSDDCVTVADRMRTQMQFLVLKRDAAEIAKNSGWNWKDRITDIAVNAASKSYYSLLKNFVDVLKAMNNKIDREQQYAATCIILNTRYETLKKAMEMMDSMHAVAVQVRQNYVDHHNTSTSDLDSLVPKITVSLPTRHYPEWQCYGNNLFDKSALGTLTCEDTWNTPAKALNIHRVWCGGDKDPNPSVAGCEIPYYKCNEYSLKYHQVKYCDRYITWNLPSQFRRTQIGICGQAFRNCSGSLSRAGIHAYKPIVTTYIVSSSVRSYWSGYEVVQYTNNSIDFYTETDHIGSTTLPSAKDGKPLVHGANGVGVDAVIPDATPNCNTCIGNSHNCPDCGQDGDSDNDDTASASPGLSPVSTTTITINGEKMLDTYPGETVSVNLVMPSDKGYTKIYWYLAGPGDSGYGSQIGGPTTSSNSVIETSVSYSFTLPSDASGVYKFTAYIYPHSSASDSTIYEYSFKVYVS